MDMVQLIVTKHISHISHISSMSNVIMINHCNKPVSPRIADGCGFNARQFSTPYLPHHTIEELNWKIARSVIPAISNSGDRSALKLDSQVPSLSDSDVPIPDDDFLEMLAR